MDVTITLNGAEITYDVEPRTLLVHYIRDGRPERDERRM